MKWQIYSVGQFYDADEGMVVYFEPSSGDTHLVSDFAAYLIQLLAVQPMNIEELVSRISPDIDSGDPEEMTEATQGVLVELLTLNILKRV